MKSFPQDSSKTKGLSRATVVIVGSGFGGLGMAINLKNRGIDDFLVIERADDVGGVWRDNSYPGCACDVESSLYSFSFAPNPNWTRKFSGQAEILRYLNDCADRFGIRAHCRFNHNLEKAEWDETAKHWNVHTSQGVIQTRLLISATGAFSEPLIPKLPGAESFKGVSFHSSQWDHDFDLSGKSVAVVGTGASAIQFIPKIQPLTKALTVFQRTPPWVMPRADRAIDAEEKSKFNRFPLAQKLARLKIYAWRETYGATFRYPKFMGFGKDMALHHMKKKIKDPMLREKLTPKYQIGCKRILLSDDYFPALAKDNVEVETVPIEALTETGIRTKDGRHREVDAIIWGTGFKVTEFSIAPRVFGRLGVSLTEHWQGSPSAFLGTTVPGFPNFFALLGPNTGLGHSSVVLMIEAQIKLVVESIAYLLKKNLQEIEPKPEREIAFGKEMQRLSAKTVWIAGGCESWYLDKNGRNSTLWPSSIGAFRRRILPFHRRDYIFTEVS